MTAGVHLGAFMAFAGLTAGIFAVLDVTLPEALILSSIAWGIGAVPIVALASAYQPDRLPTLQDWDQGLAKTLRLLTRLLTPLALLVLAIYLFGYIPMHFGGAFEERELRMVYNATIVAMLLCGAASGRAERDNAMPRYAMLALTMLTLALNLYALAAIGYRTLELGLTPNRHAVLGWNVVTLLMLAGICHALWTGRDDWVNRFAQRVGALVPAPVEWSLWLLVSLPILE